MDSEMRALGMVEDDAAVSLVNGTSRPLWFDPRMLVAVVGRRRVRVKAWRVPNEDSADRPVGREVTGLEVRGG